MPSKKALNSGPLPRYGYMGRMKCFRIALFLMIAPLVASAAQAQVPPDAETPAAISPAPAPLTPMPLPYAGLGPTVIRGIQEQNNSGEVGTVALTPAGPNKTQVVIDLRSFPGHAQPAHIHRGKTCDAVDPKPTFVLHDVVSTNGHLGRSDSTVNYPMDRLLSGNYVVDVHAPGADQTHDVACGELYLH
jgi:hypothetical protein